MFIIRIQLCDNAYMKASGSSVETFDWALIRTFLAVLDTGSLLGAARQLGLSQPTAGRHIDMLEGQIGQALFERTGRGMTPTLLSQRIAMDARRMQQGAESLASKLVAGPGEEAGLVRLSAARMLSLYLLPDCIAELQAQSPGIDIALVASDEVSNLLRREADIAIRMVRPAQSSLIARRLGSMPIAACARRDYLERRGVPRTVEELVRHRLIGPDRDESALRQVEQVAVQAGLDIALLKRGFRSDDFTTQLAGVRAGLGIGFLLAPVVRAHEELVTVPIDLPLPSLPVWLVVHREIRGNFRFRRVFDFLAQTLPAYCH